MLYQGPSTDDLDNIRALNRRFLRTLSRTGDSVCGGLSRKRLSESQQAHLGCAPFLLFSFREGEPDFWKQVLSDDAQLKLSPAERPLDSMTRELQVAGLSFLWQLSRYNPYAVRIVSGAPYSWCEQVAAMPVATFLHRTAERTDILVPRFREQADVWQRLLKSGVSPDAKLRAMAHQSAFQVMLTRAAPVNPVFDRAANPALNPAPNNRQLQVAAARLPSPGQKSAKPRGR
ncbi:MAG: hypothetical protein WBM87_01510 [Woeseiaceae bacterium]